MHMYDKYKKTVEVCKLLIWFDLYRNILEIFIFDCQIESHHIFGNPTFRIMKA